MAVSHSSLSALLDQGYALARLRPDGTFYSLKEQLDDAINAKMSAIETEISKQQETNKQMFELIEKIGDLPTSEPKKENQAFTTAKDKKQEKIDSILTTLKTLKTK